jgi:hypothetical protein
MLAGMALSGAAYAGHPPLFKPDAPSSWNYSQRQLADRALDVLFQECPSIESWLPDIKGASMHVDDMSSPLNAIEAPMFAPYGWDKVLVVSVYTVSSPKWPAFAPYVDRNGVSVDFYLGGGLHPGIFMPTSFFPAAACGAKDRRDVRVQNDPSHDMKEDPDSFVPVPALKLLDAI